MGNKLYSVMSYAILLALVPINVMADYVFTAPPRESEESGIEIYQPIATFLTKVTGEKFVYRYPANWADYGRDMQNNVYDMAFDGPHFVSWRIKNINHDAIVKLPQLH
ncbi:MAG TPA: PhnD/SsuA/transferrin family substrate-binding protein, partial [Gammaproteobacteria bacterium]